MLWGGKPKTRMGRGWASCGPAEFSYGLRARCHIWLPHGPTRLRFEREEVVVTQAQNTGSLARPKTSGSRPSHPKEDCMPRFVGLDLGRKSFQVAIVDEHGHLLENTKLPLGQPELLHFARTKLLPTDQLALEATSNTWAVVDLLSPFVARVVVSNPLRTKAIAAAKIKTDKIDARTLAELLRSNFLPEVFQPDPTTRALRERIHHRAGLVGQRTAIKNRIHALLAKRLIPVPTSDLFGKKGLAWLNAAELDPLARDVLNTELRLLAALDAEIAQEDAFLAHYAWKNPQVRLLMTLPGVSLVVAVALLAAWGDVTRFPSAAKAAAYLGLVPSTYQTGTSCYHGPITKQGASRARWLLVQAAQHLDRHPGPLGHFFRRLCRRKNRNVAVVAAARKLACIAWHMLRAGEPYRYAQPGATQNKLAALRVAATGARRPRGVPKGSPRPQRLSSGTPHRTVPSLPAVLESEGLPKARTLEELPPGELRTLKRTHTLAHARAIQSPTTKPRTPQPKHKLNAKTHPPETPPQPTETKKLPPAT